MTKTGTIGAFPRTFWVANVMELFERAAYYGLNSVLAIRDEIKAREDQARAYEKALDAATAV